MKSIFRVISICLFSLLLVGSSAKASTLYINEILASNVSTYQNTDFNEYVDIIELYNSGTSTINIGGYYLTDDKTKSNKWAIPAGTTIAAGGYKVFYCDDRNQGVHTNFQLDIKGEFIGLYNANYSVVDTLTFGKQKNDISYGRNSSNSSTFGYFQSPTIGSSNGTNSIAGITPSPQFTVSGGFFSMGQILSFTTKSGIDIYYTIDGTTPSKTAILFTSPVQLDTTVCVRAIAYQSGLLESDVVTHTFFINTPRNIPTLSIVTDPKNFFDDNEGIYVIGTNGIAAGCSTVPMNVNQDWERPVNLEYFDKSGVVHINQMAGAKIFGGCSRQRYPIKSLAFFSRKEYGKSSFDYSFFNTRKYKSYDGILLRSGSDDQNLTTFRDAVSQLICDDLEIETQAYQPVAVFINGQYWGIQNLREKYNEDYFKNHYGVSADNLNIVERNSYDSWSATTGSSAAYNTMLNYIKRNGASSASSYKYLDSQMDMESYLDYQVALIYMGMDDWPGNNIRYWKANTGQYSKWRWVCWDLDHTLKNVTQNWSWNGSLAQNTLELAALLEDQSVVWPNPQWSTFLFRSLLTNTSFKNEFIQSMAYQMNTTFDSTRIIHIIDSIAGSIAPEIPRHIARWGGQTVPNPESWIKPIFETDSLWRANVQVYRYFAHNRPEEMVTMMKNFFKLSGTCNLSLTKSGNEEGYIKLYRKVLKTNSHSGNYYLNIPLVLTAIPAPGFKFLRWDITPLHSSTTSDTNAVISFIPTKNATLKAVFEATATTIQTVVINEINYHSSSTANSGDWVELYNTSDQAVDISNWKLRDGTEYNYFTLPSNLSLSANEYIVVCEDTVLFKGLFPNAVPRVGQLGYGFANSGEVIRLYDAGNGFVDSVKYNDKAPWPALADGNGHSLELIAANLDNTIASNWSYSEGTGTPDQMNSRSTAIADVEKEGKTFIQNYPNPCKGITAVKYQIEKTGKVTIKISDLFGKEILSVVNSEQLPGKYVAYFNASLLSSGIYFYSLLVDGVILETKKLVVAK